MLSSSVIQISGNGIGGCINLRRDDRQSQMLNHLKKWCRLFVDLYQRRTLFVFRRGELRYRDGEGQFLNNFEEVAAVIVTWFENGNAG